VVWPLTVGTAYRLRARTIVYAVLYALLVGAVVSLLQAQPGNKTQYQQGYDWRQYPGEAK